MTFENTYSNINVENEGNDVNLESEYFYIKNGPFYTHNTFPCFDQPNFRANIKLFVLAKKSLKVISIESKIYLFNQDEINNYSEKNEIVDKLKKFSVELEFSDEYNLREFENSSPLPTHLFSILVGQFEQIEESSDSIKNSKLNTKMKIYFRKSMKEKINLIDINSIFKISRNIVNFYSNLFNTEYLPIKNLSHIFLPKSQLYEVSSNLIYDENLIFKNESSNPLEITYFNSIISHQM